MTAFHNGLLVDGIGELGDLRAYDSQINNAWYYSRDAQTLVAANGTADYGVAGARGAGLYDASLGLSRWDRIVVLAPNRYVLVRDDIASSKSHAYDWICHFSDGANVDTASGWVDKGREAMGRQKETLNDAMEAGKQAYRDAVS